MTSSISRIQYEAYLYGLRHGSQMDFGAKIMQDLARERYPKYHDPFLATNGDMKDKNQAKARRFRFRRHLDEYKLVNNRLYTLDNREVIPEDQIDQTIIGLHQWTGHQAQIKTYQLIQSKYAGIAKERVISIVQNCRDCSKMRETKRSSTATYPATSSQPIPKPQYHQTFQRLILDHSLYINRTVKDGEPDREVYMLFAMDSFSQMGWAWRTVAEPGTDGDAEEIAKILVNHFRYLGRCPVEIQSVNGRQFCGEIVKYIMSALSVKISRAVLCDRETRSRLDNFVTDIKKLMTGVLAENEGMPMEDTIAQAISLYNNTPHSVLSHNDSLLTPLVVWQPGSQGMLPDPSVLHHENFEIQDIDTKNPEFDPTTFSEMLQQADLSANTSYQNQSYLDESYDDLEGVEMAEDYEPSTSQRYQEPQPSEALEDPSLDYQLQEALETAQNAILKQEMPESSQEVLPVIISTHSEIYRRCRCKSGLSGLGCCTHNTCQCFKKRLPCTRNCLCQKNPDLSCKSPFK